MKPCRAGSSCQAQQSRKDFFKNQCPSQSGGNSGEGLASNCNYNSKQKTKAKSQPQRLAQHCCIGERRQFSEHTSDTETLGNNIYSIIPTGRMGCLTSCSLRQDWLTKCWRQNTLASVRAKLGKAGINQKGLTEVLYTSFHSTLVFANA